VIEKLKEENQYREDIADVLPEWKGHIAEETIQDLQKEIKRLNEELDKAHTAYRAVRKINQELMNGYV
jgi:predicted nuclease with TOPRIM domain